MSQQITDDDSTKIPKRSSYDVIRSAQIIEDSRRQLTLKYGADQDLEMKELRQQLIHEQVRGRNSMRAIEERQTEVMLLREENYRQENRIRELYNQVARAEMEMVGLARQLGEGEQGGYLGQDEESYPQEQESDYPAQSNQYQSQQYPSESNQYPSNESNAYEQQHPEQSNLNSNQYTQQQGQYPQQSNPYSQNQYPAESNPQYSDQYPSQSNQYPSESIHYEQQYPSESNNYTQDQYPPEQNQQYGDYEEDYYYGQEEQYDDPYYNEYEDYYA